MKLEVSSSSSLFELIGNVKHIGMNTLLKKKKKKQIDEYSLEPICFFTATELDSERQPY